VFILAFAVEMLDSETGSRAVACDLYLEVSGSNLGRTLHIQTEEMSGISFQENEVCKMALSPHFCGFRDTPQNFAFIPPLSRIDSCTLCKGEDLWSQRKIRTQYLHCF
jgi:hypothetical protein